MPFLADDKIVQVSGRLSDKDEEFKLIAEDIKELPNDELYGMALSEMEKNKQRGFAYGALGQQRNFKQH